ncbi:MAG: ParB/RepB/Spo0J family partition protein [Armatimonadetes bacterium]|nr:ParB/RepB/Spo0J family partition protein [Armatimonadota bacterium]
MADTERQAPDPAHSPRRALGRGLGALIPGAGPEAPSGAIELPIDRIRPNRMQPRTGFDEESLAEMGASIREHGVLQPVLVRPMPDGYELVAGERRWRAAAAAGLRTVPALVRHLDDRGALEAALVENLQRENLNPMERATAYRRLQDEFHLTQEAVARRVGRSQPSVANTLRLLTLPAEVQASLTAGRITEGHARALLAIEDPRRLLAVWKEVEAKGLSVRETESRARPRAISRGIPARARRDAGEINIIQQRLQDALGTQVRLRLRRNGSGEIRITFYTPADLERLLDALTRQGGKPR